MRDCFAKGIMVLLGILLLIGCGEDKADMGQPRSEFAAAVKTDNEIVRWKMQTHWPPASSSYADSAQVLAQKLKMRTNGRLEIELFPAGALVPAKELFNAAKRGMIQIVATAPAYSRDQVPLMNVASGLPMNFQDLWECIYFNKWSGFEEMVKAAFAQHGLYYCMDKLFSSELSLKRPVRSFEDFKGLKLRSSGILQTYLSSIGTAASYLPGSEIYAALSSGVVDGAHWGAVQGSDSMGFYEVNKYHLRPALNYSPDIWLINQKALDALAADVRNIVTATLDEHFWLRTNQYQYLEAVTLSKVRKEKGVELILLGRKDVDKMKAAAVATWEEVAGKSPDCAKAVQMLKDFHAGLGR